MGNGRRNIQNNGIELCTIMTRVLTPKEVETLQTYTYKAAGCPISEIPFRPFWNWLINFFPEWLAPNVITVVGVALNVLSTLILVYYSPDAEQEVPGLALVFCAICIFLHQTADNLDGCQCRRLKYDTPHEELYDHGCDSLSGVCITLGFCISLKLGNNPGLLLLTCLTMQFTFYISQWQAYVCGIFRLQRIDVTEAQFTVMVVHCITAYCGHSVWNTHVSFAATSIRMLMIVCLGVLVYLKLLYGIIVHLTGDHEKTKGRNLSTMSRLRGLLPIVIVVLSAAAVQALSPSNIFQLHPCFYIITFGFLSIKITLRIIVTSMVQSDAKVFDNVMTLPCLLLLNQQLQVLDETHSLLVCCIITVVNILVYLYKVTTDISNALGIYCFILKEPHNKSVGAKEE